MIRSILLATTFALAASSVHAQEGPRVSVQDLRFEAFEFWRLTEKRSAKYSDKQIQAAVEALRNAKVELLNKRAKKACFQDLAALSKVAGEIIRDFAYSNDGLDLTSSSAGAYAYEWLKKYPCEAAPLFAIEGKRVRAMAYASEGLGLTSKEASAYTREVLKQVCETGVDYVEEGRRLHQFAVSSSGLNLTSAAAALYVREQMGAKYFRCSSDVFWIAR